MDYLIITIGIPLLYTSFFSMNEMPNWLDFKPLNCNVCRSFWSVIILLLLYNLWQESRLFILVISYAGVAAYIGAIAKRLMFRI